jgi:hypothetical protein
MTDGQNDAGAGNSVPSAFWDALAASHTAVENSFLSVSATRRLMDRLRSPALKQLDVFASCYIARIQ